MTPPDADPTLPRPAAPPPGPPAAPPAALFVVLSGPSGAGKDTILRRALQRDPALTMVVTAKTRAPRPGEQEGVHHLFLSAAQFDALLARGGFLEHAAVYGHRSGVPREPVRAALAAGKTVIARTDIQGARTLRDAVPGALLLFLTVPDLATLRHRLLVRASEQPDDLERRLAAAAEEMAEARWFHHVIVNREGREDAAVQELLAVIARERARPDRTPPSV